MYEQDVNNRQWLICHKTQPTNKSDTANTRMSQKFCNIMVTC